MKIIIYRDIIYDTLLVVSVPDGIGRTAIEKMAGRRQERFFFRFYFYFFFLPVCRVRIRLIDETREKWRFSLNKKNYLRLQILYGDY